MNYTGIGKIIFKGKKYETFIELNPIDGEILALIPQSRDLIYALLGDKKVFDDLYSITDFKCNLPNGSINSKSIKYLQLKKISPGSFSIYDSALVRSFTLDQKGTGISTLTFTPKKFILSFTYSNVDLLKGNSELVFYNHSIDKITSFKIKNKEIAIGGDKDFLILNSTNDVLSLRPVIEEAISIIQGGRSFYKIGFYKNRLELSFRKIIKEAKPYGLIYLDEKDISEFFTKYIEYTKSLSGINRKKYELFISYVLDSCNQLVLLENRIVNLFIALEIIDKSKTLNKTTLNNILSVSLDDADFIIKVRNNLIHKGFTLKKSIEESKREMLPHIPRFKYPFNSKSKRKMPGSFYFYLLSRTLNYVLNRIGMTNLNIEYHKYF